jgi:CheY-like chemotaxis protein
MSRILLAEDEEALLEVMSDVLGAMGHDVLRALNGEDALALAREHRPDLVISDHMMPRRTGLELLRAMRSDAELAATRFILVSAALPADAHEADLFVSKPIDLDQLERMVVNQIASVAPAPPPGATPGRAHEAPAPAGPQLEALGHQVRTAVSTAVLQLQLLRRDLAAGPAGGRVEAVLRELQRLDGFVTSAIEAARRSGRPPSA